MRLTAADESRDEIRQLTRELAATGHPPEDLALSLGRWAARGLLAGMLAAAMLAGLWAVGRPAR